MKHLTTVFLLFLTLFILHSCSSSNYGLGKDRFIIPWDSVWGTHRNFYILTINDMKRADKIIEDSIETIYLRSGQDYRDRYLNKKALDCYYRQYSSYTHAGDTIIVVNFSDKKTINEHIKQSNFWNKRGSQGIYDLSKEWVEVSDGGNDYWSIRINLTKKRVVSFSKNGYG